MDNQTNPDRHPLLAELFAIINARMTDAANVAGLTAEIKSFKEQMSAQLQAQKDQVALAMTAAREAVSKAEAASEKRFEGVNEFRSTLADQQRTLMPRSEVEALFRAVHDKINKIESEIIESRASKSGAKEGWGYAVGIIGLVALALSIAAYVGSRIP